MATFDEQRAIERRETDRLGAYLQSLDADGWQEQSYCSEWRVLQVVSHITSGARISQGLLEQWLDGGPPMDQARMQKIWAVYNALDPAGMLDAYNAAMRDYFARLSAVPSDAGAQIVDTPLGKMPLQEILAFRLNEVVLHSWDVLVARDRLAVLPMDAAAVVLPAELYIRSFRTPAALAGKRVRLATTGGAWRQLLDFRGEKPVVAEDAAAEADITAEGPTEEIARLLSGRHFMPGSRPKLTWQGGSYQELGALNIFA
jgi:uncharacterized protein (TIGR03083 family)